MRILAIANQKGGTAKTTTAVNLAAALVRLGQRVLLLDLDQQGRGGASTYLGCRSDGRGLLSVLSGASDSRLLGLVQPSSFGCDVIASGPLMAGAEKALARELGGEFWLREALAELPADRWDLVLIDCPPSLGMLSVSALAAAREVLIPVFTEAMPLDGVAEFQQTIKRVQARLNPSLRIAGFLASRTDTTRLSRSVEAAMREALGDRVFAATIRKNVQVAESYSHEQPIQTYAPKSTGAADFDALAREFMQRAQVAA